MSATVRISSKGRSLLGELALQTSSTMTEVLDAALEHYRRHRFLQEANDAYATLAAEPEAHARYRAEIESLDGTLSDGLSDAHP